MTSTRVRTALAYLKSFENYAEAIALPLLTDTYQGVVAPASANAPPPVNRAEYAAMLSQMLPILEGFSVTVDDILEDEKTNRVVIVAKSEARFREEIKDSETDWTYKGEYVFIFTMDETGEKIDRAFEFVDSINLQKLLGLFEKAGGKLAKNSDK